MNAFPPELLHHHFACMVVAGLTPPSKPSTPPTTAAAAAVTASEPSSSPSSSSTATTTAPADTAPDASAATAAPDYPSSVFPELTRSLHDILSSRARNTFWDPSRGRAAVFHTVFADHNVRLPPLKTKPSARHVPPIPSVTTGSSSTPSESSTAAFSALPPRSPLSPLHPNSPQFPDGLIAPVWVRKHRELVPSVFVSFHCLPTASDIEQLRDADEALIKTISDRRRSLTERGIKLTIVLLTQREMLDDPQLEARLSFVRRNSGLDSKASLFVLTPVTKPELAEFVSSLHSALFEPAADYYREHARRVKRKRTRYPPPPSTLQPLVTAIGTLPSALPGGKALSAGDISWLSREGWIVRSEYKLAVFAELAGDMQEAALRYREAYDLLCNSPTCLLGSTLMLPPRTKRWAEAKVLADTLSIRICKLLLYADDGQGAAVFFRKHLARFTDLSTGWGIGAMTFEYWSWLAKQYRMFGELVEHATRPVQGSPLPPFQLAVHAPPLPSRLMHPDALARFSDGRGGVVAPAGMLLPNSNAVSVSTCPYTTLQPPGAYYYLAALCTVERRQRFLRTSAAVADDASDSSPLSHERRVDHTAQLTEALTKAYDSFKRNRLHRTALFVAARIATAYLDGGQNEMALKFLERILKSYAKDEVHSVRAGLVETAIQAAIGAGARESAIKMLIEVLDPSLPMEAARREQMVTAVKTFLSQSKEDVGQSGEAEEGETGGGESKEISTVGISAGFLQMDAVFPAAEVDFGAEMPFQVVIRNTHASLDLAEVFTAHRVTLHFQSGEQAQESSVEIRSSPATPDSLLIDLGHLDLRSSPSPNPTAANLNALLSPTRGMLAFQGRIKATHPGAMHLRRASVVLCCSAATLQLDLSPMHHADDEADSTGLEPATWLLASGRSLVLAQRLAPSTTLVRAQRFAVSLALTTPPTRGYVDERIPIAIGVHNHEPFPLRCWVDARLQPSYVGAADSLAASADEHGEGEAEEKSQSIELLALGTVDAGQQVEKVVWMTARQASGLRVVDVSVRVAGGNGQGVEMEAEAVTASGSASVDVGRLFGCKAWMGLGKRWAEKPRRALLDFDDEDESEEEAEEEGADGDREVGLDVEMVGEEAVVVSAVELLSGSEVVSTVVEEEEVALGEWLPRDRFSFILPVRLDSHLTSLQWRLTWTRPSASSATAAQTAFIPVSPTPSPPAPSSSTTTTTTPHLYVTLTHPLSTPLSHPLALTLTLHNPHPTHTLSLILTLDSDEHFTLAGTRRLTLPFLLPGTTRVWPNFARLVPQALGRFRLPVVAVRLLDPSDASVSLALVDSRSAASAGKRAQEEEAVVEEEKQADAQMAQMVQFTYARDTSQPTSTDAGVASTTTTTTLPRVTVHL